MPIRNGSVREERTFWRDEELSQRHREWGYDCPCIDIDFLLIEYDRGHPSALVEYKNENAPIQLSTHPSYQALINLGNSAKLPVFGVRYAGDFSWFKVVPLNNLAKKWVLETTQMTEYEWVTLLYRIRGYDLPDGLFENGGVEI